MLYPTELLRLIQKIFNFRLQPDSNELPLRRRPLYPTELRGLIQKIFTFAGLQDSNDSIFRRGALYPIELLAQRCRAACRSVLLFYPLPFTLSTKTCPFRIHLPDVDRQKPPAAAADRQGQCFHARRVHSGRAQDHRKFRIWIPETKSQGLFHQIQKEVTFCGLPHGADA